MDFLQCFVANSFCLGNINAVDISKIILLNNYCYILIGGGNWW